MKKRTKTKAKKKKITKLACTIAGKQMHSKKKSIRKKGAKTLGHLGGLKKC